MTITAHGGRYRFYKGVSTFTNERGRQLVFFGNTPGEVLRLEQEYLLDHYPISAARIIEGKGLREKKA